MLGVIIPTLEEADRLGALLGDLATQRGISLHVVVADGGSQDDTPVLAADAGAEVVVAPRGRARQLNAGRRATRAPWLLFLHADTRLESADQLAAAVAHLTAAPRTCGHFRLRFDDPDPRYRFLEAKSALNRPYTVNGDQGLLVHADLFDELGGFDERTPFLEDQRFAARMRDAGIRWTTLPGHVTTSTRRFRAEGFGPRYFAMALIMAAWVGEAEEFLASVPELYRARPESPLDLRPLLDGIAQVTARLGVRRGTRAWLRAAALARENLWQLFFALDVALAEELDGQHPFLNLYDDRIAPRLNHRAVDLAIAAGAAILLLGVLPAFATYNERRARRTA